MSTAFAVAEASEAEAAGNTYFPVDSVEQGAGTAAAAAKQHGPEGFPRALAALRLTRLFAARMVSTLDASQLRAQFYSRGRRRRGGAGVGVGGGGAGVGGGGGAITEGQEEAAAEQNRGERESVASTDLVTALLASLMALLCASEQEDGTGAGAGSAARTSTGTGKKRRSTGGSGGGGGGGGGGVLRVEGFSDLQLEGVGLLLVLLGTQAYGPPPSPPPPRSSSPKGANGGEFCGDGGRKRRARGRALGLNMGGECDGGGVRECGAHR